MGLAWSTMGPDDAWVAYADEFYDSLNETNRAVRPVARHTGHSREIRSDEFAEVFAKVRELIRECPRLRRMHFKVLFLDDAAEIEGNMPHTFGDAVMLPTRYFKRLPFDDQVELLIHEMVHVYQRKFPIECHRLLTSVMGYTVIGTLSTHPDYDRVRRNPDLNDVLYANKRHEYALSIVSPNATSVRDAQLVRYDARTHKPNPTSDAHFGGEAGKAGKEHPYEHMAYSVADMLTHGRLPAKWRARL